MELGDRSTQVSISAGTIFKAIVIALICAVLFVLRDLVLVLLTSIVVASAVEPGTQWFVRRRIPRLFSVILIYFLIAVALVGVVFFLLLPLLSESADFLQNSPMYFNSTSISHSLASSDFLSSQPFFANLANGLNLDKVLVQISAITTSISSNAFGTITTVFGGILSFLLMGIISFYLAVEEDGVGKFLKAIAPIKHEKYIVALWKRSQRKIGLWMQGQLVLAVIIGMLVYLGLLIIIIPNALLLAGLYIIVHQFENQLIYPLVVKKVVGVSPIVSIVALVAGWELAGFIGLVLAVPISSVITEFFDDLEKDKVERSERMLNNK
jgi:predicted PurR-regulated permease PerM